MTTTESNSIETTVDAYFAMWSEADRAERLDAIARAWTAGGHYVDPLSDVTGHAGIADMVEAVRSQYPGATFELAGAIDAHHDVVRFPWRAIAADGTELVAGVDVAVVADDGRFQTLAGFFG